MPFGLRNAAQTFQRFIDKVLRGLDFCYAYIDDLLIASHSPDEHKHHLRLVFERLCHYGVIINPQKCAFGVLSIEFLGHSVNSTGIHPLPAKVQTILDASDSAVGAVLYTAIRRWTMAHSSQRNFNSRNSY